MKRLATTLSILPLILACTFSTLTPITSFTRDTDVPPSAPTRADAATKNPQPTAKAATATRSPTSTPVPLSLRKIDPLPTECRESPLGLPIQNMIEVAYLPTGFCFNGEIDLFEKDGKLYVAQSLSDNAAFFIADVTDPTKPTVVGAWQWSQFTYTADLKAFKQKGRNYLVLSQQRARSVNDVCGVEIVDVTTPSSPTVVGYYKGSTTGNVSNWCDVHTSQVSVDAKGDGAYIYLSSTARGDLRVIDIRDFKNVREVNHYTYPLGASQNNFVHDTTIVEDRVYVAYWSAGLIILDKKQVEAGQTVTPLNPADSIKPSGFKVHQAYPTADGNFVFIEDEVDYKPPFSQLRLFDIRDMKNPKEVLSIALENPLSSPHNLLIDGDKLYVGWYMDGVRVFKYDVSKPDQPRVEPIAYKAARDKKGKGPTGSDIFDGVWGVRLRECSVKGEKMTCVYASDLTRGLFIVAMK